MRLSRRDLNKPTILKALVESPCKVTFIKVKDNTVRSMVCTLNPQDIPVKFEKGIEDTLQGSSYDADLVSIWDVTEAGWRSFRISRVISFEIIDKEDKKEGHKERSKQHTKMTKKKIAAKEAFAKRVKEQKEKQEKGS